MNISDVAGFVLCLAVVAAVAATVVATGAIALLHALPLRRLNAARRADLVVLLGLAPAVVGVAVAVDVALPAVLAVLGVVADHCASHAHHGHLCPQHLGALTPSTAAVGAVVVVVAVARAADVLLRHRRERQLLDTLARLGRVQHLDDGTRLVVVAHGSLLHAAHRFVVASAPLLARLSSTSTAAALAHEAAHVRRADARWLAVLGIAGVLAPPGFRRFVVERYRQAAEEAADEAAALDVGAVDVAEAIVAVARVRRHAAAFVAVPAATDGDLDARVTALLGSPPRRRENRAAFVTGALLAAALATTSLANDIHHGAEAVLDAAPHHHH